MWVRYVRFLLGVSVCLILSGPVIAADSTPSDLERNALLQAHLARYITSLSAKDGGFRYLDRQDATIKTAYPASLHPQIITIADSYFLCITMRDDAGNKLDADFLIRLKSDARPPFSVDDFIVTDAIIGNRQLLEAVMAKAASDG